MMLQPLLFRHVYKDYLWGGTRIPEKYNREVPDGIYAESWEITDRPEGMSIVRNGPFKDLALGDLVRRHPGEILGRGRRADRFPLLIKLIHSRQVLSVQVHPDDAAAARTGGEPKTEMWYVLEAGEDACVYSGFKPGMTPERFDALIAAGTIEQELQRIPVTAGDAIFTPGGRVHAVGEGCLLLEVQQNSDTTYRIHDWNRAGPDGKPRPLHIEEAKRVIHWDDTSDPRVAPVELVRTEHLEAREILATDYFRVDALNLSAGETFRTNGKSFHALFVASGAAKLTWEEEDRIILGAGVSCLIPAGLDAYALDPVDEPIEVLRTSLP